MQQNTDYILYHCNVSNHISTCIRQCEYYGSCLWVDSTKVFLRFVQDVCEENGVSFATQHYRREYACATVEAIHQHAHVAAVRHERRHGLESTAASVCGSHGAVRIIIIRQQCAACNRVHRQLRVEVVRALKVVNGTSSIVARLKEYKMYATVLLILTQIAKCVGVYFTKRTRKSSCSRAHD